MNDIDEMFGDEAEDWKMSCTLFVTNVALTRSVQRCAHSATGAGWRFIHPSHSLAGSRNEKPGQSLSLRFSMLRSTVRGAMRAASSLGLRSPQLAASAVRAPLHHNASRQASETRASAAAVGLLQCTLAEQRVGVRRRVDGAGDGGGGLGRTKHSARTATLRSASLCQGGADGVRSAAGRRRCVRGRKCVPSPHRLLALG